MASRRWRGTEPPIAQADPITNGYALPQVSRQRRTQPPYARRAHVWSPPVVQANPLTNGYVLPQESKQRRTQPYFAKRAKVTSPPWGQAAAPYQDVTSIAKGGERRFLGLGARRGKVWSPPLQLVAVVVPFFPGNTSTSADGERRFFGAIAPRRSKQWSPPWGQANPITNGYALPQVSHQRRTQPPYQRRAHIWSPPTVGSVAPLVQPPPFASGTRRRIPLYARRGHLVDVPWGQAAANTNQPAFVASRARARYAVVLPIKRSRSATCPLIDTYIPASSIRRQRAVLLPRRLRGSFTPFAVPVVTNPAIIFNSTTRRRTGWQLTCQVKRGRTAWPPLIQIPGQFNPPFVHGPRGQVRRALQRMWARHPLSHRIQPPWAITIAPAPPPAVGGSAVYLADEVLVAVYIADEILVADYLADDLLATITR